MAPENIPSLWRPGAATAIDWVLRVDLVILSAPDRRHRGCERARANRFRGSAVVHTAVKKVSSPETLRGDRIRATTYQGSALSQMHGVGGCRQTLGGGNCLAVRRRDPT